MNENTNALKDRLEAEKTSLETQLATIGQPSTENPGEWEAVQKDTQQEADPNDQADHLDEYQENRAILDVLNTQYKEVVAALARIEDGTYGICEVGNEPIEADRLEADPSAKTCKAHME
jgi:RNA polymerase-binding transcription factor DksA